MEERCASQAAAFRRACAGAPLSTIQLLSTSNRLTMKSNRFSVALPLLLSFGSILATVPAYGANKDIIELQTEVTQLQQQMTQMKQSFDERMGVMKNLLEQNTDVINKASAAVASLQSSI